MLDKLNGWKTYISAAVALVWTVVYLKFPGAKDAIGGDNFGCVLAGLLAAGGISLRAGVQKAGVQKAHDAATDAADAAEAVAPATTTTAATAVKAKS